MKYLEENSLKTLISLIRGGNSPKTRQNYVNRNLRPYNKTNFHYL